MNSINSPDFQFKAGKLSWWLIHPVSRDMCSRTAIAEPWILATMQFYLFVLHLFLVAHYVYSIYVYNHLSYPSKTDPHVIFGGLYKFLTYIDIVNYSFHYRKMGKSVIDLNLGTYLFCSKIYSILKKYLVGGCFLTLLITGCYDPYSSQGAFWRHFQI